MRKIKLRKISYKRVGFPTCLYDKKPTIFIDRFAHDASFQKNHLFHIPYIYTYIFFVKSLCILPIEKDIAPVVRKNTEDKSDLGLLLSIK